MRNFHNNSLSLKFKNFLIKLNEKIFNKKVFKATLCVASILFLIFAPGFIFNKSNYQISLDEYMNLTNKEKIVLELWHIETFEGGTNSRKMYLENQAIKFNKQNNNCFVSVKSLTEEQLYLNLQSNNFADVYSFGIGSGYMLTNELNELPKNNEVRKDLQEYSKLINKIYAYPYILSGYALISHANMVSDNSQIINLIQSKTINKKEVKGVGFSSTSSINPSKVLIENSISNQSLNNYFECSSTYNAYTNFLSNKFISLLGTARDVARIKNRELNGSIGECNYNYFSNYSDLIQYVGVSKNLDGIKEKYAKDFASYLTSNVCQNALKNYGLFSTTNNKIYESDYMSDFENALSGNLSSINVFSNLEQIEREKNKSFNSLFN